MSRRSAVLALLLAALLVVPPQQASAVSCVSICSSLSPCLESIKEGGGPAPSAACCDGIRSIVSDAKTADDRRETCKCLKSVVGRVSQARVELAAALPAKCGVSVPVKISTDTDGAKVQ